MATAKRMEKRLNIVEDWMKRFEQATGPTKTMDNMNWLVAQLRLSSEQMDTQNSQLSEMSEVLQRNSQIVQDFVEEQDIVMEWQSFINRLQEAQEEQNNAVQVEETESVDAREQAEDGEEMGEGDA
jgi:predicted aspartyl protease|tara:strand:- start:1316 stop:1693 length:378 start_codon:yes stop_codon:yes gene_type:complete